MEKVAMYTVEAGSENYTLYEGKDMMAHLKYAIKCTVAQHGYAVVVNHSTGNQYYVKSLDDKLVWKEMK